MEFAVMGHWQGECLERPVKLLIILHALRLECVKSMDWTASSQRSRLLWSSFDSKAVAALLDSTPSDG